MQFRDQDILQCRAVIDFRVTGRMTEDRVDEEAQIKEMRKAQGGKGKNPGTNIPSQGRDKRH